MIIALMFLGAWLGVCSFALWRGGQPERWVAAIFLIAFPATAIAARMNWWWAGIHVGIATVDIAMMVPLVWVALRAVRGWPLIICAMQLLQISSHFTRLVTPELSPMVYWIGNVVWAYFQLPLLLLGTIRHVNRERRDGKEPSWAHSSDPKSPPIS